MKRKSIFWAGVVLAAALTHSCRLPSAVQINADNFGLSVPLRTEADFSAMFRGILEDAFEGGDNYAVRIFDMVDAGEVITFLAAFELEAMLPSFNPSYYLADFASHYADGISPIEVNIRVPDLSWSSGGIPIQLNDLIPDIPGASVRLPEPVVAAIEAASDGWGEFGGFLNADVGSSSFVSLSATFSPAGGGPSVPLSVNGQITVSQEASILGGDSFPGLSESDPWVFSAGAPWHSLQDSNLNGEPIRVNRGQSFLTFTGANFAGGGTAQIEMGITVANLNRIRLNPEGNEDFVIDPIEVDFTTLHDRRMSVTDFIQEIHFSETGMSLDFSRLHPALEGSVKLAVTSERLGFDGEPETLTRNTAFTGRDATLSFEEVDGYLVGAIVDIGIELVPLDDKRYFEFGPVSLAGNGGLYIDATVGLTFEWEHAKINTNWIDEDILSGNILDEPINMGDTFGDLMNGFTFANDSIEMAMFLAASTGGILDAVTPKLTLNAVFGEDGTDTVPLFGDREIVPGTIPVLPSGVLWNGGLPGGGIEADMDDFFERIGVIGLPRYLGFSYEVYLGGDDGIIHIYRDMFDDNDDGDEIRTMVMMKLALDFQVSAGGYFSLPLFTNREDDIFGRDAVGEPLFGNDSLDVRMLMLRLYFDESIFEGTRLHLDANGRLFSEGLALNDGRSGNLEVRIDGNDFDIINRNLIPPDVRIVYPRARNVRITRDLLPTRIAIAVSGSYRLEL